MKKFITKHHMSLWLLIMAIFLIFGFTSQTGDESNRVSHWVSASIMHMVGNHFKINPWDYFWTNTLNAILRKLAHFSEFLLLGFAAGSFLVRFKLKKRLTALLAIGFCTVIAGMDELRQIYITGRTPRWFDFKIDMLGAVTGVCIFIALLIIYRRHKFMKQRIQQLEKEIQLIQERVS